MNSNQSEPNKYDGAVSVAKWVGAKVLSHIEAEEVNSALYEARDLVKRLEVLKSNQEEYQKLRSI